MNFAKHGRTEELIRIFEDTRDWYEHDPELRQSVEASIAGTVLYPPGTVPALGAARFSQPMSVSVSRRRTLEAALFHLRENPWDEVTVLNFASAPGMCATRMPASTRPASPLSKQIPAGRSGWSGRTGGRSV